MAVKLGPPSGDSADQSTAGPGAPALSSNDPTVVSGQDPESLFGFTGAFYDSGAAGSAGAPIGAGQDPTNMSNQYPATEPISGVSLDGSGAPGGTGVNPGYAPALGAGSTVTITDPNYMAGKPGGGSGNQFISVSATTSGTLDSTTMPGQYADNAGNNLPYMYQPTDTGAGQGTALHGGFMNGHRPGERA